METLDAIDAALHAFDGEVHYGIASKHDPSKPWNYTVFSRSTTKPKENLTGYTDGYLVAVVRENHVPENTLGSVVDAMRAISGMKLDTSRGIEYVYDVKPGTSNAVEMMLVYFVKGRKS